MDIVLINQSKKFLANKELTREKNLYNRLQNATDDFDKIVKMIIKKYNPGRIYQWGSLLNKETFSEISDIDIAVEGIISAQTFFAMYRDADKLTRFPLHLVQIEKIRPVYAKWIKRDGQIVYEKRNEKNQSSD